jgi:predicted nucleic acid-binding protein
VKTCLLDTSFLIDLLNEIAVGDAGIAHRWLRRNAAAELWISPVTLAEVLQGAADPEAVKDYLRRYSWQGIHRVHADKVASIQRRAVRRVGENDAFAISTPSTYSYYLVGTEPLIDDPAVAAFRTWIMTQVLPPLMDVPAT